MCNRTFTSLLVVVATIIVFVVCLVLLLSYTNICNIEDSTKIVTMVVALASLLVTVFTYLGGQQEKNKLYRTSTYNKYLDILLQTTKNLEKAKTNIAFSYLSLDQYGRKKIVEVKGREAIITFMQIIDSLTNKLSENNYVKYSKEEIDSKIHDIQSSYEYMHENYLKDEMWSAIQKDIDKTSISILCNEFDITKSDWIGMRNSTDIEKRTLIIEKFLCKEPNAFRNYITCCLALVSYVKTCYYYENRIEVKKGTTLTLLQTFIENDDYVMIRILSTKYQELLLLTKSILL